MIKKRYSTKSTILKLSAFLFFPFSLFGGIALSQSADATEATSNYVYSYSESVNLTNSSFTQGGSTYLKGNSLSGWNAIETDSQATGMLIDVGSGTNTEEGNNETITFSNNKDTYMLSENPGAHGDDSRILMINSKSKVGQSNHPASKGYRSTSITLEANSYYRFSVSAKTMLNGDEYVNASIYLSGLVDENGDEISLGYENLTSSVWKEYFFYIATGNQSQTVTLDLYLGSSSIVGSKTAMKSEGVVFFDNASIMRYSENEFYNVCKLAGYTGIDKYESFDLEKIFLVDTLKPDYYIVENTDNINLDFEDEILPNSDSLGEHWSIVTKSNANAVITNIRDIQPSVFKNLTEGHEYVGDDLSYNNSQALVLWTNSNEYSSSYIGVKSDDISIMAHDVYKITLKMKSAGIDSGSFYLKVSENNSIYSYYPTLLSDDENAKNYYAMQEGKTSGITANVTNAWTNDYQTVTFYIKGHSLYNSSFNLEFWLGDTTTSAKGCVIIDNIQIEHSSYSDYSSATDKLELLSFSGSPENISNAYFNSTQSSGKRDKYPLVASDWTTSIENELYNDSGIVYLGDDYDDLYVGNYDWAGINPDYNKTTSSPNNVYMMFNRTNSYQSLTSSSYALSNSNNYYRLSFDYYNQDYSNLNKSKIKVEVIDENGIVLFSKEGISSIDKWSTMQVEFQLSSVLSSPTVKVKISLGENDDLVGGIVYLDNFDISSSTEDAFLSAQYKADLTDYYMNLTSNGEISREPLSSPAYNLSIDEVYNDNYNTNNAGSVGGIVDGKNNVYGIVSDNSNFLVISNKVASKSTLTSQYPLAIDADKNEYYKLTFDLATIFDAEAENASSDQHECMYGVSISIDGYKAIENLVTASQLKSFTIYYKVTQSSTPTISFSLISDCDKTIGTALLSNLNFAPASEDEFTKASLLPNYSKTIFTSTEVDAIEEDNTDTDNATDTETSNASDSTWLLIPSIIMAVALIIAIIGFILRHVKIKKIERIRKESYDRKLSVNHDVILVEAQKRRDKEVTDLQKAKKMLEQDKVKMEEEHKAFVRESRQSQNGKLSREIEKAFKKYNTSIARIDEKINIIKEKIDFCMTADYLLSIERKVMMEEENNRALEKKALKAKAKEQLDNEEM